MWSDIAQLYMSYKFPDRSIPAAKNYCRDPNNIGVLWCFVSEQNNEWYFQLCEIDICGNKN
jgi:hypothetical protein